MNVNKVIWIGRIAGQVELKKTKNGTSVATISVATSKSKKRANGDGYEDVATFMNVKLWGNYADYAEKHTGKGDLVYIEGSIDVEKYETQTGEQRYSTLIVVGGYEHKFMLLRKKGDGKAGGQNNQGYPAQSRPDSAAGGTTASSAAAQAAKRSSANSAYPAQSEDDDLPF